MSVDWGRLGFAIIGAALIFGIVLTFGAAWIGVAILLAWFNVPTGIAIMAPILTAAFILICTSIYRQTA